MWSPRIPSTHVVVDLETLGTGHDSQIFEIGACVIKDGKIVERFSKSIRLEGNLIVCASTLQWWMTKPSQFSSQLFDGNRVSMREALQSFSMLLMSLPVDYVLVGNGATFDITMLESAYEKEDICFPCSFHQYRDLRTYKELYERITNEEVPSLDPPHVALVDAELEAQLLIKILERFAPVKRQDHIN